MTESHGGVPRRCLSPCLGEEQEELTCTNSVASSLPVRTHLVNPHADVGRQAQPCALYRRGHYCKHGYFYSLRLLIIYTGT